MTTLLLFGAGQLGRLFAGGALHAGTAVVPITRDTDAGPIWSAYPSGTPILCAVGEADLEAAVDRVPADRRRDLIFVQNELYPDDLAAFGASDATLAVVWTNKKPGLPTVVGRATAVGGPHAAATLVWHEHAGVAARPADATDLARECAAKYAFIVAVNGLGLADARTVGAWRESDSTTVDALAAEATALACARLGDPSAASDVAQRLADALDGFASLPTRGRSSPARIARALARAQSVRIDMPRLARIAADAS